MLMENSASFLSNSMAKSTTAALMLAAMMDLSGVPLPMTLIKIRNMDSALMNVSLTFLLRYSSDFYCPATIVYHLQGY